MGNLWIVVGIIVAYLAVMVALIVSTFFLAWSHRFIWAALTCHGGGR